MSVSALISCVFEIRPRCYTFCSSDPRKQTVLPPSIPLSLAFLLPLLLLIYPSLFSLSPHSRVNVCTSVIIVFQRSILKHTKHGILHCTATSLPCLHTLACWPCLAGGRAVHKGTSKSLIYIFFSFSKTNCSIFCLTTFPRAYHPPLPTPSLSSLFSSAITVEGKKNIPPLLLK